MTTRREVIARYRARQSFMTASAMRLTRAAAQLFAADVLDRLGDLVAARGRALRATVT